MKKIKNNNRNNIFQVMIRTAVKEELLPINIRFEQVDKRFEQVDKRFEQVDKRFEQMENNLVKFKDEIMAGIDQITGMLKKHEEELEILRGDHRRIIKIEEYLKI